jgi:Arc/MetJ-type ribon-helix-helix transcriptional regulator
MVVTTIALPEALHKRLAIAAIEDGTVMTEVVRAAVREWLDRRDKARLKNKGAR